MTARKGDARHLKGAGRVLLAGRETRLSELLAQQCITERSSRADAFTGMATV